MCCAAAGEANGSGASVFCDYCKISIRLLLLGADWESKMAQVRERVDVSVSDVSV